MTVGLFDDLIVDPDLNGQADEDYRRRWESLEGRCRPMSDWASVEVPDDVCLLGPLVVKGYRTVVVGHTGHGKTTFVSWALRAMLRGEGFIGLQGPARPARAFVIDCEQTARTTKRRLHETGLHRFEDSWYLRVSEGLSLERVGADLDFITEVIREKRPDVVVLDPLYKAFMGNPSDPELAMRVLRSIDALREEFEFALILPMHPRKPPPSVQGGGSFSMWDAMGTGTWLFGAEVIVGYERAPLSRAKVHWWKDRDGDVGTGGEPWILGFDRECGFDRLDRDDIPGLSTPASLKVLRALRESQDIPVLRSDLADHVGLSEKQVARLVQTMREDGMVIHESEASSKDKRRAYMLPSLQQYGLPVQMNGGGPGRRYGAEDEDG